MKKKIFSSLLLVAFAFAATSMFVSCKDYDDDINELRSLIDGNNTKLTTDLQNLRNELQTYKSEMTTRLSGIDGEINTLKGTVAGHTADLADLKPKVADLLAFKSTTTQKLVEIDKAISDINDLLGGKLANGKTYKAAVEEIYGRVEALETKMGKVLEEEIPGLKDSIGLLRAVDADLQIQINTLKDFKKSMEEEIIPGLNLKDEKLNERIDSVIGQLNLLRQTVSNNSTAITNINNMLGGELEGKTYKQAIADLTQDLQDANDAIEDLQDGLSQLNVLIKTSLRSLVFKPACYYEGIEACKLSSLNYLKYDLPAAAWNIKEKKGYDDDERYPTSDGFKVLSFVANYYMNPSSADLSRASVKVLDEDYEYIIDRASAAGLTVKDWKVNNGMLAVNLKVQDNSLIKRVSEDGMVTTFATQVTIASGSQDTTITSDWAAVVAEEIDGLVLAHQKITKSNPIPYTGVTNPNEDPACEINAGMHLMPTVNAAKSNLPQDTCFWNATLDLEKLVELHYTTTEEQHKLMDAATMKANGLKFKFELTSLILGENLTDESAHAAIQGSTFRPQPADKDGKQQAYGAEQIRATEVGRTPLVRVSLIDEESGDVLDYGYIRIKIVEPEAGEEPDKPDLYKEYTGGGYAYNGECEAEGWSYKTTWNQTEWDLYNLVDANREEWEANYGEPVAGDDGSFQQYEMTKPGIFKETKNPIGTINAYHETSASESGTVTHTIEWIVPSSEAYDLFVTNGKNAPYSRAIKYESKDKKKWPDVYVVFTTGKGTVNTPTAKMVIDGTTGIDQFWYTHNTGDEGFDEIRTNTLTPEDNAGGTAEVLDATFSDVFYGNLTDLSKLFVVENDQTENKEYAADQLELTFAFDKKNNGKEYKGVTGKTYVMAITEDGKTLQAYDKADKSKVKQNVAIISGETAAEQKIEYQKTDYAKDLLNYVAHNALNDQTITAIIGANLMNECQKSLNPTETFDVRFLRPLNVYSKNKQIEDASIQGLQKIKLADLVEFDDWRDAWNGKTQHGTGGTYYTYYGITGITIDGVEDGQVISTNPDVLANLGQDAETFVSLKSVSDQLDFTLQGGELVYKNLSNNVTEFTLKIPVMVEYIWGKVPAIAQVKVIRTHANAKKN